MDERIVANLFDFSPLSNVQCVFSNVSSNLVCESHCGIVVIVGIVVHHSGKSDFVL